MPHVSEKGEGEEREAGEGKGKKEGNGKGWDMEWIVYSAAFCGAACSRQRLSSQGAERGCTQPTHAAARSPSDSGKTIIFRANANFLGRSQHPKLKKKIFYL